MRFIDNSIIRILFGTILVVLGFSLSAEQVSILDQPKPITVNYRDTDIKDVLRSISELCSVNIVSSDTVKGNVTISLKDVNLADALEAILTVNHYAWKVKGQIIYVESEQKMMNEFIQLKYSEASTIQQIIDVMKSDKGSIMIDVRSNKIIIHDYEDKIREMKKIVDEIDIPTPQVTINAKIIDINISDAVNLGLKFGLTNVNGDPENEESQIEVAKSFQMHEGTADEDGNIPVVEGRNTSYNTKLARKKDYTTSLRSDDTTDGTFSYDYNDFKNITNSISDVSSIGTLTTAVVSSAVSDLINVQLDALITKGRSLLLASPTITTLNNETASIIIGDKVGIKEQTQTTTGTTETIRFQDVGTKLEVTPTINVEGYITMKIKPEISSVVDYTQDTIQFRTREAQTKVRVRDGQTVILGGLIKNEETIARKRVPIFSKIPVLGIPFRSKYDSGDQTELVVFLTPKILNVQDDEMSAFKDQNSKRTEEAKAKEEELLEKFGDVTYGQKYKSNIDEENSLAKKLYKEAVKLKRKSKRVDDERGLKILEISKEKFKTLIDHYGSSKYVPKALYELALVCEKTNDIDQALNALNQLMDQYPEQSLYKKAKKKKKKMMKS